VAVESTYKGFLNESNKSSEPPKLNSHYSLESDQRWRLESDQRWRLESTYKGLLDESNESSEPPMLNSHYSYKWGWEGTKPDNP
jgi:hypothetical protein